jgi:hypothetical protein
VRPAFERAFGQHGKESLDEIEPGAIRRCEVEMKPRMPQEPAMHGRRFMRGEIVEHDVDLELGVHVRFDRLQEPHEVLGPMLRLAACDHLAGGDVQRGEEILGLVPATDEQKAKARKVASLASRTNFALSIPLALCMGSATHGLPF